MAAPLSVFNICLFFISQLHLSYMVDMFLIPCNKYFLSKFNAISVVLVTC